MHKIIEYAVALATEMLYNVKDERPNRPESGYYDRNEGLLCLFVVI